MWWLPLSGEVTSGFMVGGDSGVGRSGFGDERVVLREEWFWRNCGFMIRGRKFGGFMMVVENLVGL